MTMALTYEEWRSRYAKVEISEDAITGLREFHGIDAVKEVESAMRMEYQRYIDSLGEK